MLRKVGPLITNKATFPRSMTYDVPSQNPLQRSQSPDKYPASDKWSNDANMENIFHYHKFPMENIYIGHIIFQKHIDYLTNANQSFNKTRPIFIKRLSHIAQQRQNSLL